MVCWDLDYFKDLNDEKGHFAGDRALRDFANLLSTAPFAATEHGRVGGDEFISLIGQAEEKDVHTWVAHVREELASAGLCTVSAGVAQRQPGDDSESWRERADQELYHSKHARGQQTLHYRAVPKSETTP